MAESMVERMMRIQAEYEADEAADPANVAKPIALNCERPRDINLIKHRLRKTLHEYPTTPVTLSADEARTLMESITYAERRLCSD